jgi:hypothetical protein
MPSVNWKRVQPTSLSHAMELCIQFAKARHNRSIDLIADLMGLTNKWSIYKWIENGNLPARLIRPFEHACGCDFITRYLAHSAHRLLIDIPTGRKAKPIEIPELYQNFSDAVGVLAKFYEGNTEAEEAIARITGLMEGLAWHRSNVEKHLQPELEFGGAE